MKHLYIVSFLVIMLVASASTALAQGGSDGALYSHEIIPCPDALTGGLAFDPSSAYAEKFGIAGLQEEIEGETYSCGLVTVPENYDEPDGRTIELFYLKLHSSSQSPAPDPLIYLSGGPGHSSTFEVTGIPINLANLNQIRERRDIIAYDQRGTGFSNYLLCAPFLSTFGVVMDQTTDSEVPALIESMTDDPISRFALQFAICPVVYNAGTKVDLAQYNSVVSAQDIIHVAEALGYTEGYNLYGTSYGTRLAQFAMRGTPDQIRSVVIDGVVSPSNSNMALTVANRDEHYRAIFAQCAANPACNAAYPDLSGRFATLLADLADNPVVLDPPLVLKKAAYPKGELPPVLEQIDPQFFVALAGENNALINGGTAHMVPRMILALEEGDTEWFRANLGTEAPLPDNPAPPPLVAKRNEDAIKFQQPLFEQPLSALLTFAQLATDNAGDGIDVLWNSIVLGDFAERLVANEDQDELIGDLVVWSLLPYQDMEPQTLIDFADERLSDAAAARANTIMGQMTGNDLRQTLWTIQDIATQLGNPEARDASGTMQNAVNCAEDAAFSSIDDASDYIEASPYPQLIYAPLEQYEIFTFGSCISYPTPLDESVTDPVTSDIPTLVFQEALDTQTPLSWGQFVAENLGNSVYVEWDNMGHIAIGHDIHNCAGDIAAAFFDNPELEPSIACSQSDAYQLQFMLPE